MQMSPNPLLQNTAYCPEPGYAVQDSPVAARSREIVQTRVMESHPRSRPHSSSLLHVVPAGAPATQEPARHARLAAHWLWSWHEPPEGTNAVHSVVPKSQ